MEKKFPLGEYKTVRVNKETMPDFRRNLLIISKKVFSVTMSYDAKKYALVMEDIGYPKLFYLEPENLVLQEFSYAYGFCDEAPVMTKDGNVIYFVSDRFGNKEIYRADRSQFLAKSPYLVDLIVDNLHDNFDICIDYEGTKLAYISKKEDRSRVYIKNIADGTEFSPSHHTEYAVKPLLSGDGKFCIYTVYNRMGLMVILSDLEKKVNTLVTDFMKHESLPAVNGTGARIAFTGKRNYLVHDMYMYDRTENVLFNITDDMKSDDTCPNISDDGKVIAYQADGQWDQKSIRVIDERTKNIFWFHEYRTHMVKPQLSADGNTLIFQVNEVWVTADLEAVRKHFAEKAGTNG